MKRVTRCLARLYPASWRGRYGSEFDALLEDVGSSWRDSLDVLWGALKAQMITWEFGKIAAVFAIAGVLLAWAASFAIPVRYVSQAYVRILGKDADAAFMNDLIRRTLTRNALTTAIIECGLYSKERSTKPMEDIVRIMEGRIVINRLPAPAAPNSVLVKFLDEDKSVAQNVVKRLVAMLVDEDMRDRVRNGTMPSSPPTFNLLELASLPERPVTPARRNVIAVGLSAGVLAGVLVAAFRRRSRVRTA